MKTLVKDLMSNPLVTIPVDSKVAYARELMNRKGVNALPVVDIADEVTIKGIVTSADLRNVSDDNTLIGDIMNHNIQSVSKNHAALAAAHRMIHEGVHHLLVVENNKPVGMLSSIDFVRMLTREKERFHSRVMFV